MKTLSLLMLLCCAVLFGCRKHDPMADLPPIVPETAQEAAAETDPFLKVLANLPPDRRATYVHTHQKEAIATLFNNKLRPHLQKIMSGVPTNFKTVPGEKDRPRPKHAQH